MTDPDPANGRAVRAYTKAGFQSERLVDTPDGTALIDGPEPMTLERNTPVVPLQPGNGWRSLAD